MGDPAFPGPALANDGDDSMKVPKRLVGHIIGKQGAQASEVVNPNGLLFRDIGNTFRTFFLRFLNIFHIVNIFHNFNSFIFVFYMFP